METLSTKRWQIENKVRPLRALLPSLPKRGWIQFIREAFGMSTAQLARRLSISRQAMLRLEKNEIDGSISLASLERVANELQCNVMVTLIPRKSMEEIVTEQAKKIAQRLVKRGDLHMGLENQKNDKEFLEKQIESMTQELVIKSPKILWNEK